MNYHKQDNMTDEKKNNTTMTKQASHSVWRRERTKQKSKYLHNEDSCYLRIRQEHKKHIVE